MIREFPILVYILQQVASMEIFHVSGGAFEDPIYNIQPPIVEFIQGQTYRFEADNVSPIHPFNIGQQYLKMLPSSFNCIGCESPLSGNAGFIEFTIPNDETITELTYYCIVPSHRMLKTVPVSPALLPYPFSSPSPQP